MKIDVFLEEMEEILLEMFVPHDAILYPPLMYSRGNFEMPSVLLQDKTYMKDIANIFLRLPPLALNHKE